MQEVDESAHLPDGSIPLSEYSVRVEEPPENMLFIHPPEPKDKHIEQSTSTLTADEPLLPVKPAPEKQTNSTHNNATDVEHEAQVDGGIDALEPDPPREPAVDLNRDEEQMSDQGHIQEL